MTRKKKAARPRTRIPNEQWTLPAGIHRASGAHATLRAITDPSVETVSFEALSRRAQAALVAERIWRQPTFRLLVFGSSIVSKRRAMAAVRARTPLGETLIRIEQRLIADIEAEALRRRKRRRRRKGRGAKGSR